MANHYLQFSDGIDNITAEQEAWFSQQLRTIRVIGGREYEEDDELLPEHKQLDPTFVGPRFLRDFEDDPSQLDHVGFEYDFESDHKGRRWLSLYATEHGDPDRVGHLVWKYLKEFAQTIAGA